MGVCGRSLPRAYVSMILASPLQHDVGAEYARDRLVTAL